MWKSGSEKEGFERLIDQKNSMKFLNYFVNYKN